MHIYWYYAFLRLLMKLVSGQSGHEVIFPSLFHIYL